MVAFDGLCASIRESLRCLRCLQMDKASSFINGSNSELKFGNQRVKQGASNKSPIAKARLLLTRREE
ncbi:hypothetical protein QVD17_39868 [Tagetes erecta]|uniref:Uncharacterized protein n=1 Tax=Tagetes erecta TaxID=13708 RepID=A0AAD8JQV1_TARER|nr:hypothetical protein QVD17_39868 [Tagetes erecta]